MNHGPPAMSETFLIVPSKTTGEAPARYRLYRDLETKTVEQVKEWLIGAFKATHEDPAAIERFEASHDFAAAYLQQGGA